MPKVELLRRDEQRILRVPAPHSTGHDVGAPDPAVDAEQLDAIRVAGQHPLTAQGQIMGTLQYMAPEQIEGKEADVRSDVFAFGLVLYELLTGKHAFAAASHASLVGIQDTLPTTPVTTPRDRGDWRDGFVYR